MNNYREAEQWLLKAQAVPEQSEQVCLPAPDQEHGRIKALAARK